MALTALGVAKLIREGRRGHYADAQGSGLYLKVSGPGRASWCMRFKRYGILREMGLGSVRILTLAEARERAIQARKLLLDGIDPIEARRADRVQAEIEAQRSITVKEAAAQFIAMREGTWGDKHAANFRQTFDSYVLPVIGHMPVSAVDTPAVLRVLEPHWLSKTETMSRLAGRLSQLMEWAIVRGLREGDNPASNKRLKYALPARPASDVKGHAAMPANAIPALMRELENISDMSARALRFLILTAARTDEVLGATWDEIDLAERLWVVPGPRMKMSKEHRVPLSEPAMAVLAECKARQESARVFPGQRWSMDPKGAKLHQGAMWQLVATRGVTVHGFRSSFSSWAANSGFRYEHYEMALAHAVGSHIERLYQRSTLFDQCRQLMDAWGAHCCGGAPAEVIQLRR